MPLISLIPKVLVEVGISDLFDRLNVIDWINTTIIIVHVNPNFLESSLSEQEALYPSEGGTWRVVGLLDERKLFSLVLIEASLNRVSLPQPLKS